MNLHQQFAAMPLKRLIRQPFRKTGFTLIELLVVIAVIAILAALLLPALARAKTSAYSAKCKSNERQIGIAMRLYLDDFRGYPHQGGFPLIAGEAPLLTWDAKLLNYMASNRDIFFCPAVKSTFRWKNSATFNFCYGYNYEGTGALNPVTLGLVRHSAVELFVLPVSEGAVKVPSDMIMIGDYPAKKNQDGDITPKMDDPDDWPDKRHNGGANVVFCDGHVEYAKQQKWLEPTDIARRRWNNDHEPHPETWH
jgi:prepilin-type N-terminal cleavage/methylation domain-containing protein/prepilin-type processing-associated H-X9-DG protein